MSSIESEIHVALQTLNIEADDFQLLPEAERIDIANQVEAHFVSERHRRWWWEHFKCRPYAVTFIDQQAFLRIADITPDHLDSVYFIVSSDEALSTLPLFYITKPYLIQKVLGECSFFEYYIVSINQDWLICENHHNVLMALGYKAIIRLRRYTLTHAKDVRNCSDGLAQQV